MTEPWTPPCFATHRDDPAFAGVEVIVKRGPPTATFEMVERRPQATPEAVAVNENPDVEILPPEEPEEPSFKPGAAVVVEGPILRERVRCPRCRAIVSPYELSLWWCDEVNDIAPRCSGCRSLTNRAATGPTKEDILRILGAPEWHQKWTRVQRKIAAHHGRYGGVRATIGVVD